MAVLTCTFVQALILSSILVQYEVIATIVPPAVINNAENLDLHHQQSQHRLLQSNSYKPIAGYVPETDVTDYSAIAYDQAALERYLGAHTKEGLVHAYDVYEYGANSKSYANVTALRADLQTDIFAGIEVYGLSIGNQPVTALMMKDYRVNINNNNDSDEVNLQLLYTFTDSTKLSETCQAGDYANPKLNGCFVPSGNLTVPGIKMPIRYKYNPETDNLHAWSIHALSAKRAKFYPNDKVNSEAFPNIQKYQDWFGSVDFADKWIQAAFAGQDTSTAAHFKNGNLNFAKYDMSAIAATIRTVSAYFNIGLYTLRQLDDAVVQCNQICTQGECSGNAVGVLDQAVAYYTGALQGTDGKGQQGNLMYALADKYCAIFKTCGKDGDSIKGKSSVNIRVFNLFDQLKSALISHDCSTARSLRDDIVSLFYVPLIQATLQYAYITATEDNPTSESKALGSTFAAAVIPMVYRCSQVDARIIYENTKNDKKSSITDYEAVKSALERHYDCLRITCADVGGLYSHEKGKYLPNAEPCTFDGSIQIESNHDIRKHQIIVLSTATGFVLLAYLFIKVRQRIKKQAEIDDEWNDNGDDDDSDDDSDDDDDSGEFIT